MCHFSPHFLPYSRKFFAADFGLQVKAAKESSLFPSAGISFLIVVDLLHTMSELDQHAREIFEAALKLPPKERVVYLDRACGGDTQLRQRIVEALFKAQESAAATAQAPPSGSPGKTIAGPFPTEAPGEKPGDRIGHYKLLQQIGEGGMGTVWMAEQEEPIRRRVGLKVIKLGMDTKQVIGRFEAERQALALMDHPNIAKVLDAGSTDQGRPFFVMELVKGTPITEYCDREKLDTAARLNLFVQVCQAIQHAHQKGIIHRDIKPSNILVALNDQRPMPKVIDFGIAKATTGQPLTDKTIFTAIEQFMGTPAYMSPEQAEMNAMDIDTRSDIYALGVLLYELLTGRTPFDAKRLIEAGLHEIRRIIREEDPPRPSRKLSTLAAEEQTSTARCRQTDSPRLIHLVRGDLDRIVMKTLEKDRNRRYETANGLAMDIERYLNSEPILARAPTPGYRLGKFARKHRSLTVTTAAITMLILSGFCWTLYLLNKEHKALRKAEQEAQKSKQVTEFLKEMFGTGAEEGFAGLDDNSTIPKLADRAARRIDEELRGQPEVQADLYGVIGKVYLSVLNTKQAIPILKKAVKMSVEQFGSNSLAAAESMADLARAMLGEVATLDTNSVSMEREKRALGEMEGLIRASLTTWTRLLGKDCQEVAGCLSILAAIQEKQGDLDASLKTREQALAIWERVKGTDPEKYHAVILSILAAKTEAKRGHLKEAEFWYRKAILLSSASPGNEPLMVSSALHLVTIQSNQTNLPAAERTLSDALATIKGFDVTNDYKTPIMMCGLASQLAEIRVAQTNWEGAEKAYSEAIYCAERTGGTLYNWPKLLRLTSKLSIAQQRQGKFHEAEKVLLDVANDLQESQPHPDPELLGDLSRRLVNLYSAWGKPDEAAKWEKFAKAKTPEAGKE
jgi:serine/threonine protein kinase